MIYDFTLFYTNVIVKKSVSIFNKTTIDTKEIQKHIAHIAVDGVAIDLITTVFTIFFLCALFCKTMKLFYSYVFFF